MSTATADLEPRAVGVDPAARYLGLSVKTLRRYDALGTGPRSFRVGRRVLYDVADLDAWVDERKAASTRSA